MFFKIWFIISVLGYAFIFYKWLTRKPTRQELAETKAKLKLQETTNEILKRKLPKTLSARLARMSELADGSIRQ